MISEMARKGAIDMTADVTTGFSATTKTGNSARRYDLDWLRVIAFACLIFYHTGMAYVTWDFHVKSDYASTAPEWWMMLMSPWRLALLFFISGVAFRFASDKSAQGSMAVRRLRRLGLPIIFGMLVIVAPQTYFQVLQSGDFSGSYLDFQSIYLTPGKDFGITMPTWNHLWYVVYLLVYSLIFIAFLPILRSFAENSGAKIVAFAFGGPVRVLTVIALPFLLFRFTLDTRFETTHDLFWDWANHAHRFTIFALGYFVARNPVFWSAISKALPWAAGLVLVITAIMAPVWANWDQVSVAVPEWGLNVMRAVRIWYAWLVIATLLGLAQRFLNRPSAILTYFNKAVFSWYILHQTVIIAAVYWLTPLHLGGFLEFVLVALATVVGCALFFEVARRLPGWLSVWVGVDPDRGTSRISQEALASSAPLRASSSARSLPSSPA